MKITPKRIRLALRSRAGFIWALKHVVRSSPLGRLERRCPRGWSLKPDTITVNITGRCNLRCAMCMQPRAASDPAGDDAPSLRGARGELTPDQWRRFVDQIADARPAFYFSGGEPLLYAGLCDVLRHVHDRGMLAGVVTNGTALEKHAEDLVRTGVDNVTVSLDGPPAVHDAIRKVPGTFERATRGIRALHEARDKAGSDYPRTKINCVVTPGNIATLEETRDIAFDLGVDEFNLQHPMFDTAENVARHNKVFAEAFKEDNGRPGESRRPGEYYEMSLDEETFRRLERVLRRLLRRHNAKTRVLVFPEVPAKAWRAYYLDADYRFPERCLAPWKTMRLLADGTFEPCLHYEVGNITAMHPWQLWNSPRMRRFRSVLARRGLFPGCRRCCYRDY